MFTIERFEIYRIVLCNFVCEGLLSLIFAYFSFIEMGKRLEYSLGSTAFSYLLLVIATLTNICFLVLCYFLYFLSSNKMVLMQPAAGIWMILLGLIAVESTQAPVGTKRRLFVVDVPVLYYPVSLFLLFTLVSGFRVYLAFSTGVGYLYGFGYLDRLKVSQSKFLSWENGCLKNFTERKGWVVGHAATGSNAWLPTNQTGDSSGGWNPSSFFQGQPANNRPNAPSDQVGSSESRWAGSTPGKVKSPSFPGSGQSLGTTTNRTAGVVPGNTDARMAMLAAAERRAIQEIEANTERDRND